MPARPPPPCRLAQNPVRRALKFSGFVGVQLHASIFVENCFFVLKSQPSPSPGPGASQSMPATRPGQGQVCLTCLRLAYAQVPGATSGVVRLAVASQPTSAQPAQPRPRRISEPRVWMGKACFIHTWAGAWVASCWLGWASRRHVRHASRRAEGLGLRLVSGWHTLRPGAGPAC